MQEILHFVLQQTIDRSGFTVPEITEKLGRERSWLYRLLNRSRPVRIEHAEEIYAALGHPIAQYFVACLNRLNSPHVAAKSDLASNPSVLLRILRGESNPDLGWLEQFRSRRVSQPDGSASYRLHPKVRRIDDAREFNRQAALVDVERWLRSFERRCRRRRITMQETSQLATALGVWASIQRVNGHQALGLKALELAWELHGDNPWIASTGDLLERSSTAVYKYGYPLLGVPLMQRAHGIVSMLGDPDGEAKTMLGLGILAFRTGNGEGARSAFEQVLEHPGADSFRRVAAGNYLAMAFEASGALEQARSHLNELASYLPDLPIAAQLPIRAVEARVLQHLGDLEGALAIHEDVFAKAQQHYSPLNRAVALLHLVETQMQLGRVGMLSSYSGHLAVLIGELEETPLSREILKSLLLRIRTDRKLAAEEIVRMREEIAGELLGAGES